jgi:hypothetical protein
MVILSQIQSNKKTCHECNKKVNIIFTCSRCGSQYCKDHKSQDSHNCEQRLPISQSLYSSIDTTSTVERIYTPNNTSKESILDTHQREKEVLSNNSSPKNRFLQKYAYPIFYLCIFTIILGIFSLMFFV